MWHELFSYLSQFILFLSLLQMGLCDIQQISGIQFGKITAEFDFIFFSNVCF